MTSPLPVHRFARRLRAARSGLSGMIRSLEEPAERPEGWTPEVEELFGYTLSHLRDAVADFIAIEDTCPQLKEKAP